MTERRVVKIGNDHVGDNWPSCIVAEAGINHNGDMSLAKELIVAAKEAGADAIKFQAFTAERLCGLDLNETKDVESLTGGTKSSYAMYKSVELSDEDIIALAAYAKEQDILFFLSVFDEVRVDFLDEIDTACYKISSGDITHLPLLRHAARKGRPMILSTGMATLDEVKAAVRAIEEEGNNDIVLLHCTADYPPKDEEINLAVLATLNNTFLYPIGYSDHSEGSEIPLAAAALRATMIEKHFTLDRDLSGPDHALSVNPSELKKLVSGVRRIEAARGIGEKLPTAREEDLRFSGRRGIKASRDLHPGHIVSLDDVKIIKPAAGIQPAELMSLIGKPVSMLIEKDAAIEWSDID